MGTVRETGEFCEFVDPQLPVAVRLMGQTIRLDALVVQDGFVPRSLDLLTRASIPKVVVPDDPPTLSGDNWALCIGEPFDRLHEAIQKKR